MGPDMGKDFMVSKCKVMHFGSNNPQATYTMNNVILDTTVKERDIGVLVQPLCTVQGASRWANTVLGQISRSFHYRDRKTFVRLYI